MSSPALKPIGPTQEPTILPTLFGEGYGMYAVRRSTFVLSFVAHMLGVALLLVSGLFVASHQEQIKARVTDIVADLSPYVLKQSTTEAGGGGGGGDHDKLIASKGALPKTSMQQITPPQVIVRNPDPKLTAVPTVVIPPEIRLPTGLQMGDPLAGVMGPPSNGTGVGGGIGSGAGGGVGSGHGPGVGPGWGGGIGGGAFKVGGGVSAPRPIFNPDPEYSEEARKAKYQGTVVLWIVVGPDGKVYDMRIQRSLGLGLDEKAMEAVKTWRFDPAKKDGQPVKVQVLVEVNFRLF